MWEPGMSKKRQEALKRNWEPYLVRIKEEV